MKRAGSPPPYFHRLEFGKITLLLRANAHNGPEDAPESSCVLASYNDQMWFAVSARNWVQERYKLEGLTDADMIYIESGHLKTDDPNSATLIQEFKERNDPATQIVYYIPHEVDEVPIAQAAIFRRQTYQKLIASPDESSHVELMSVVAKDEMTVSLFHRHEHSGTREGDYDRTVFGSTSLRFVPCGL